MGLSQLGDMRNYVINFSKKKNFPGYLSHFMFMKRAKMDGKDILNFFLDEIGKLQFKPDLL